MLPGFRFLFGAIVLCFSILVFGLGAAALFRAAHEEFASRPSWRGTPGTMLAQQNEPFAQQSDPSPPVLALLEVEPDDKEAARETSNDSTGEAGLPPAASEATAAVTEPSTGNLADAPKLSEPGAPGEPSPVAAGETAKAAPTTPDPETMAHLEPGLSNDGPAAVEHAAPPAAAIEPETTIASLSETASKAVEPLPPAPEPINVPAVAPQPTALAPQIAALGSAAATDAQAREKDASNETRAKAYRSFIKHRLRAQRIAKARRRLAQRARMARQAAIQRRPAAPFIPGPTTTTVPVTTNVPTMTHAPTAENPYRF